MRNTVRVLVADGDVGNQSEVQELLVRHRRFIVTGGTDGAAETETLAREFQPDLLLVNVDDPANLHDLATSLGETLRGTPVITYSHQPHADAGKEAPGLWIAQHLVIPVGDRELLAAIESALGGLQQSWQLPFSKNQLPERDPLTSTAAPNQELSEAAALLSVEGKAPLMRRFAELVSDWTRAPSSSAQEAFLSALAENVCAPAFGGFGREAVRKGLKTLASRFGSPFIVVLAEHSGKPILKLSVQQDDGSWEYAGHFLVGFGANGTVTYLDYHADEPEEPAAPETSGSAATQVEDAGHPGGDGSNPAGVLTQMAEPRPVNAREGGWPLR